MRLHPDLLLGIFPYAGRTGRDKCKNRFYVLSLHADFRHISLIGRYLDIIGLKTAFSFASTPAFSYICTKVCIGNYDRYSQKSDYRFFEHRRPAILFGAGVALRTQSHEQRHRSNPRQQPKEHRDVEEHARRHTQQRTFGHLLHRPARQSLCRLVPHVARRLRLAAAAGPQRRIGRGAVTLRLARPLHGTAIRDPHHGARRQRPAERHTVRRPPLVQHRICPAL